ncbi:hypothetical protein ABQE93_12405 [Mycolicibacterium sp. XJ662]
MNISGEAKIWLVEHISGSIPAAVTRFAKVWREVAGGDDHIRDIDRMALRRTSSSTRRIS